MQIQLHKNARTTPATREYIQQCTDRPVRELAAELGVSQATIRKWRNRKQSGELYDRSHARHNLLASTSDVEERLICELRSDIGLSLDDIVEVMTRCVNPSLSRSAIHRCLKRYGISGRQENDKVKRSYGEFEETTCGFIHMDVKYLPKIKGVRQYVYAAIDRITRYVYVEVHEKLNARTAADFTERFLNDFLHKVHTILTDNGGEWTDRFSDSKKGKAPGKPSGYHLLDRVCKAHHIKHKLTRPYKPQTNGMIERFNRRLNEHIKTIQKPKRTYARAGRFENKDHRKKFVLDFVEQYNKTRLQCLKYHSPRQMLSNHAKGYT